MFHSYERVMMIGRVFLVKHTHKCSSGEFSAVIEKVETDMTVILVTCFMINDEDVEN